MRYLPLEAITEQMLLAHSIFSNNGKILLKKRTNLTPSYIRRIQHLNYTHLYVYESSEEQWDCTGLVSDKVRSQAMQILWDCLIRVIERKALNSQQISFVIEDILRDVLQKEEGLFALIDLKTPDNYLYNHSLNVCILSILIGKELKLEGEALKELATGAFLHDLGKVYIKSSLKEIHTLSTKETAQVKQHTKKGFEILRAVPGFSMDIANIAYQHHERENGSGYPLGLIGKDITLFAKIVAAADSYDAMISERAYREPVWNDQALRELEAESPIQYNREVIKALQRSVAPYPVGSIVQLSDQQSAVVVEVTTVKTIVEYLQQRGSFQEISADSSLTIEKRLAEIKL